MAPASTICNVTIVPSPAVHGVKFKVLLDQIETKASINLGPQYHVIPGLSGNVPAPGPSKFPEKR